jgi:hypothetical protein
MGFSAHITDTTRSFWGISASLRGNAARRATELTQ